MGPCIGFEGTVAWQSCDSTLNRVMEACRASLWLPLIDGLLRYPAGGRRLSAEWGPFLNCAMDAASIEEVQAACFAALGQLCPSLSAPVVLDVGGACGDAPALIRTPHGSAVWMGERAPFAMLVGRLPQPQRDYINQSALFRLSAAQLATMGLQEWSEAKMKRIGDGLEVGFAGRGMETCGAADGLLR